MKNTASQLLTHAGWQSNGFFAAFDPNALRTRFTVPGSVVGYDDNRRRRDLQGCRVRLFPMLPLKSFFVPDLPFFAVDNLQKLYLTL